MNLQNDYYAPDVLLVFIGHSSDARSEANVVYNLQQQLQKELDRFTAVSGTSIAFRRVNCWEWNYDALPEVGGQDRMITPAVDRADIAVFVFKRRVGDVSWEELNRSRKRTSPSIPVIAAFTATPPENISDLATAKAWTDLLERKQSLSDDWTASESLAVKPIAMYEGLEDLGSIVFDQLKLALDSVLKNQTTFSSATTNLQVGTFVVADHPQVQFDQRPVLNRKIVDLDIKRVDEFLSKPLASENVERAYPQGTPQREQRLSALGLTLDGVPTMGTMLCFGSAQLLATSFNCCGLQMAVFSGEKRADSNTDISTFQGNLLDSFEAGMKWLATRAGLSRRGTIGSGDRDDLEVPNIVLREALANALVHRDFEDQERRQQPTCIDVYVNRIEITSHGRLPQRVSLAKLNSGQEDSVSTWRNPVVARIFQFSTHIELKASGVPRMHLEMAKAGLRGPVFCEDDVADIVRVTLLRPERGSSPSIAPRTGTNRAFISHSSPDDRYVQELLQLIRGLGYSEFLSDSHPIKAHERSWPRIEQGIRECDAFVVVLSDASVHSDWIGKELEFAKKLRKKVIPVRIDDCQLPTSLEGRDVIELRQDRGEKVKIASSRLSRHAARNFFGREQELELLDNAWADPGTHVLSIVAWGGVGKTALVTQWLSNRMIAKGWPDVERFFDWSFYSQGTGESRQTSSALFINDALKFFGDPDPTLGTEWERGERLAGLIRQHKTLLVLDGIEPLQYPPTDRSGQAGLLKDSALEALLQSLVQDNNGLCIVTSREHLTNIDGFPKQKEHKLEKLTLEAAIGLIRHLQLIGTDKEIEEMWDALDGHALSILQLGRLLARGYGKDLRKWREIGNSKADKLHQGRSTMKVMAKYESWLLSGDKDRQLELAILRLMGLFEKPMSPGCFEALRTRPTISGLTELFGDTEPFEVDAAVTTLIENELLSHSGGDDYVGSLLDVPLDAHPLVREYFAAQLQRQQPEAFQAAHSRLFDYLCETTPHRPDGLAGLAPLYQAVSHGCLAGRQQEACDKVYFDRILRGTGSDGVYSTKKLGAIGADFAAVAAFFVPSSSRPWSQVSPNLTAADQAWLLNQAAFRLRALGRLTEALQPMRAGLERRVQQKNWKNAAISASNLSELELTLGRLPDAVTDARQSITHADQSGEAFLRMAFRTTAADALHQSGQRAEAGNLFAEAERMQQERQSQFDLLYSLPGFQYCDWLMAPVEQTAWHHLLHQARSTSKFQISDGLAEVERRANRVFEWRRGTIWRPKADPLLDIALDHLTLARVGLIRASLATPLPQRTLDLPHVADASNGLRAAGQVNYLPLGLLTAALYHFVRGEHDLAEKHLAEAQQIAERGPMPLFLADIYLTRARLTRDRQELAKARTLIDNHGYGRRLPELEDAEAAAETWPDSSSHSSHSSHS